jgi:hypothetical protein
MRSPSLSRLLLVICVGLAGSPVFAQGVPGKNVSLVGPTPQPAECTTSPFCAGLLPDHGLKQQNEPSCAISPETGQIMCGGNDYRGVDRIDGVLGDAWMGAYMSRDNGLTWLSRLAPGYKGSGTTSLNLAYGADPVVMAFPGGMLYVFIAGNRGENEVGGVYSQQWVEVNKEDGFPFVPALGTPKTVTTGTSGRFLDKPGAMINMLPSGTCNIPYAKSDGTPGVRTVPAFEASVAFAIFLGSDQSEGTAVWVIKSSDCGATWDSPGKKVTQTININQGVSIAAIGSKYVAAWRSFNDSNQPQSAIQYSVSNNRGQSWSKAGTVANILPFDQGTSSVTFRTTALPWLISDGTAFHVFWAERKSATDPLGRIKVSSSTNGTSWSTPAFVDNVVPGHQFMPSATSANGITQIAWYDTRDDHTQVFTQFINDFRDEAGVIRRHTADIRGAQATWNGTSLVISPSVKISSYRTGLAPPGFAGPGSPAQVMKLEDNFVNSRIFRVGTTPFIGDYVAVAAKSLTRNGAGAWVPNTAPSAQTPNFFVAWTDNRLLRGNTVADLIEPTGYTPPTLQGEPDPGQPPVPCVPGLENTRNQEIFGSMIRPGLIVSVPSAPKQTGLIQRAYVVQAVNTTSQPKSYKVQIASQPPDAPPSGAGRASFLQSSAPPDPLTPADTERCIAVQRRSGAAVTVFVTSTSLAPSIVVNVNEADATCQNASGAQASVTLNFNPQAPDMENPDFENPDFENFNLQFNELHNPDFENRTLSFFTIAHPDMENPDFENYTLAFPDMENPDFENPDFENFSIAYSSIKNPDMENPDFENAVIAAGGATELTWSIQMKGNTTSAIDAAALFSRLPDTMTQLIVRRVYATNVSQSCSLVPVATNQVVVNTVAQAQQMPTGSFALGPGEVALVTIRMVGEVNPATIGVIGTAQSVNTDGTTAPFDADLPVADVTPPVLTLPGPTTVEATDASGATVTYAASATDDTAGSVPVQCSPASGSTFPFGATIVNCSADDGFGNVANGSFVVTVVDSTPPVLIGVPSNMAVEATGQSGAVAAYASPTASDNIDGAIAVTCAPASGSTFPIGVTTVTCTAIDSHGNTAAASFTITVADTTAPIVGPHANLSAEATSGAGAAVNYTNPTATDNVGVVSFGCVPASGSVFPLGVTTVTCTARDAADNAGTGTFTVAVVDTTAPAIAPHAPVSATASTPAGGMVTYTNPTATDLVDGAVAVTCQPASGSTFPLGATTVNCTATDSHLNQAASSFTVTVNFAFIGLLSPWQAPPPVYTVNLGRSVSVKWKYTNAAGALLDTSNLQPIVTFTKLQVSSLNTCSNPIATSTVYTDQAYPGNSYFNYSGEGWHFNWQSVPPVTAGCYWIKVTLPATGQVNGPFVIRLR